MRENQVGIVRQGKNGPINRISRLNLLTGSNIRLVSIFAQIPPVPVWIQCRDIWCYCWGNCNSSRRFGHLFWRLHFKTFQAQSISSDQIVHLLPSNYCSMCYRSSFLLSKVIYIGLTIGFHLNPRFHLLSNKRFKALFRTTRLNMLFITMLLEKADFFAIGRLLGNSKDSKVYFILDQLKL